MDLPITIIDAFAERLLTGNPAAVCPLDAWLPAATMRAIAAEMNLSETVFFAPELPGKLPGGRGLRHPLVHADARGRADRSCTAGWRHGR